MRLPRILGIGVAVLAVAGCRAATRVVEEPRVDMELDASGGNRGFLVGTPPASTRERRTTRQVLETEFEVPPMSRGAGAAPSGGLKDVAPPEVDFGAPMAGEPESSQQFDTYVVKRGDTLWSIAADPRVFGDATKWRRLFSANQDTLKTPDGIRAGMTLRIPRGGASSKSEPDMDSGTTVYTK